MKIGIAGLGRMGAAIAKRLMDVDHEVVVWNRSPEKVAPLADAGATVAASPAELVAQVEAVITILTDADAIDAVYRGEQGLLSADGTGKLFIDMSTVRPETEVALAKDVLAKGASFVECPVGGTVGPALSGKLLGVAGAPEADFAKAKPILEQLCRRVDLVGAVGAGASMKLAINLPLAISWQALGEAYALCRHLGADPGWLMELFADTSGGTNVLKVRGANVAKALQGDEPGSATFDCDGVRKDLRTMIDEAKSQGFALPLTEKTLAVYDEASEAGWGLRDCVELPAYWTTRKS
jgi:3-hydroxyisobutyrate dehydrogenase